ncbi:pilin [Micromonospora rifamycinica]|uniref:pilin n=1 Tax=Micromonospora rifamycinica TaxID=291594 RepID=UPI0033C42E96
MGSVPPPRPEAATCRLGAGTHDRPVSRRFRPRMLRALMLGGSAAVTVALILTPHLAYAAEPGPALAVESIQQVANNIRAWLVGILVAVATLFLTVGGLRYLAANGDPGETEKAKLAMRSAAIGYALALLAPLFVTIVGTWVA